ncbi:pyridoxamine 5'-phosphate oxidase family protein [Peptoniphilus equinus]|uniref:Pyridoxamine 5'-phosphate oxidase family protein n=1 Tax=Peptoniphilus equinus TaxID=3016343 RepID=A0ABY7QT80_9FIRM|nr:pyridoxamine 5'-phosphate oxidase family protein [Peptoniphilus equinus]WBW49546.1 pyridoxamine 5'-phosphate oxidase family protein [Peptoniphilus equinus]
MRRHDREVTDSVVIDNLIRECETIRIGLRDGERVYIVPLDFGFEHNTERVFYFHGAGEGRKVSLIEATGYAAFEMDLGHRVYGEDTACSYGAAFQSVIGEGKIEMLHDLEEKRRGLIAIMEKATGKSDWTFEPGRVERTAVIKLTVTDISCKIHN